ncbi:hypothetical protein BDA96_01G503800, partial [Sorghum bicolor]
PTVDRTNSRPVAALAALVGGRHRGDRSDRTAVRRIIPVFSCVLLSSSCGDDWATADGRCLLETSTQQIVKENQKLHKVNIEIEDEISEQKGEILQVEEGFRGTLLTSSVSPQLC